MDQYVQHWDYSFSNQTRRTSVSTLHNSAGLGTRKESTEGGVVWARRSKATVPRDGLTPWWGRDDGATQRRRYIKSINGFKDFLRTDSWSRTEKHFCRRSIPSLFHFIVVVSSNFLDNPRSFSRSILEIDQLHVSWQTRRHLFDR